MSITKETAITVSSVSKDFELPHEKTNSIKQKIIHPASFFKKSASTQHALKDISFQVKEGEFFGIVGRNGSGKSTLLKILAQIYQPTSGSVSINGKLMPFIELGVGFNPELTGRENVFLNGALLGFSKEEVEERYKEIVEFAELEEFMDQKLKNYSSGMQVRLAFSIVVQSETDILLIDEVLAVGDAAFQRKCFNYFKQLKKAKKTVVFVTHDMDAVREYCDRAMLIEDGLISLEGKPSVVAQEYTKLFQESENIPSQEGDEQGNRWGKGDITFIDISQKKSEKGTLKFLARAKSKKEIEAPVFGIRLRDPQGQNVLGSNTQIEGVFIKSISKNETVEIIWEFEDILSDGDYSFDMAIMDDDKVTVQDWWDDAVIIKSQKKRHTPYPVTPEFNVVLKKKK